MEIMNTDFTLDFRGTYIHVQHAPDYVITPEGMNRLYQALAKACRHYRCNLVFAEGASISRQLNMAEAFESGTQIAWYIAGLTMACVLEGYKKDELTEFFITVARNRGARVDFFSTREEAFQWLGIQPRDDQRAKKTDNGRVTQFLM